MRDKKPQTIFFFNVLGINDSDSWNLKEDKKNEKHRTMIRCQRKKYRICIQ